MKILVMWLLMMSSAFAGGAKIFTYEAEMPTLKSTAFLEMYKPQMIEDWNSTPNKPFGLWVVSCDNWDMAAATVIEQMQKSTVCVSFSCQNNVTLFSVSDRYGPNDVVRFWDVQKDDPPPTADTWGEFNAAISELTGMETRSVALAVVDDFYKDSPDHDGDFWLSRPLSPQRRILYRVKINMKAVRNGFAQCGKAVK